MIHQGLSQAIENLVPVEFILNENRLKITITNYTFSKPEVPLGTIGIRNNSIYPSECRQRAATYKGKLYVDVDWYIDGIQQQSFQKDLGDIPIMLKVRKQQKYKYIFQNIIFFSLSLIGVIWQICPLRN